MSMKKKRAICVTIASFDDELLNRTVAMMLAHVRSAADLAMMLTEDIVEVEAAEMEVGT